MLFFYFVRRPQQPLSWCRACICAPRRSRRWLGSVGPVGHAGRRRESKGGGKPAGSGLATSVSARECGPQNAEFHTCYWPLTTGHLHRDALPIRCRCWAQPPPPPRDTAGQPQLCQPRTCSIVQQQIGVVRLVDIGHDGVEA